MKSKLLLLPLSLLCVCACSPFNNNDADKAIASDDNIINSVNLQNGQLDVYIFTSYGSSSYYHLLESYNAPLLLETYNNFFKVTKDETSYYYSIPMYQYSFIVSA